MSADRTPSRLTPGNVAIGMGIALLVVYLILMGNGDLAVAVLRILAILVLLYLLYRLVLGVERIADILSDEPSTTESTDTVETPNSSSEDGDGDR